ncbi:MAG TPA: MMPL family transporter [Polyangia bacterium]|jgi:predicted RND superfamily exporter protein|nr:MMPL family transporter [Polyangia bacterium]
MTAPAHSRIARYHGWITRHPVLVLVLAGVLGAGGAFLAQRLQLKTAISELLPSDDPGVIALTKTQQRIGDLSLLLIGIRSPDPAANVRYAKALTEKLHALPPKVVALATYNITDVRAFFERNKWLYVSEPDLEAIRDRLRSEIQHRKNPLYVSLGEEESLDTLQKRVGSGSSGSGLDKRFPDGLFSSNNGQYVWIAALPPGGLFVERAGEGLLKAAQALIAADPPTRYHPQMRAEFSGPVTTAIAARQAVERDILWVTITCLTLVGLSIGLYFKRLRAIPLTGVPAILGTIVAFAVADIAFGYLNSSTAFLGSIILGNGINYAIVLMSRYEEHRARGQSSGDALRSALAGVWRATLVASIAASAAYASLMVTSFRGFYQFGVMGAVGSLCSWLATFTVLPAMLIVLDRRGKNGHVARAPIEIRTLAKILRGARVQVLVVMGLVTVASLYGLTHFLRDPFEYDFRKLNAKIKQSDELKEFNHSFDQIFGRWPSPTIVLADSIDEVETIRATIRKQDKEAPGNDVIGQIATIYDLLPGPPDAQRLKLELIAQIRKMTHDPALEILNDKDRKQLAQVDPPSDLRVLGAADLPPIARRPFTEVDGTVGRVVLVYPPEQGLSVWSGKDLLRIASVLQRLVLPNGKVMETSGSAVVFGAMIRSVLHDGPVATVASLIAVLIIVSFTIRPARAALLALGTLALGVLWMVGAAGVVGVRVTFLNFIALPITFGIGAEYALNVVTRYREERNILKAVTSTGGAVALCSWTTILGYGSLLAARNQALQGFGALAILGEVACLAAAIIAMPAFLLWRRAQPLDSDEVREESGPTKKNLAS